MLSQTGASEMDAHLNNVKEEVCDDCTYSRWIAYNGRVVLWCGKKDAEVQPPSSCFYWE